MLSYQCYCYPGYNLSYHLMVLAALMLMSVSEVMGIVVKCVSTSQDPIDVLVTPVMPLIEMITPVIVYSCHCHQMSQLLL